MAAPMMNWQEQGNITSIVKRAGTGEPNLTFLDGCAQLAGTGEHNLNCEKGGKMNRTLLCDAVSRCGPGCGFGTSALRIVPRLNIIQYKNRSRELVDILRLDNVPLCRNHIQAHIDSPHHTISEVTFPPFSQLRLCSPVPANFKSEVMFPCSRQLGAAILNTRETKKVRLGSPVPANFSRPRRHIGIPSVPRFSLTGPNKSPILPKNTDFDTPNHRFYRKTR
ncbi:hypothetical protein J6590_064114 [Homalodisca vitripennis]|nr:hypothetical protein J6590_064114 [Homalodisca vitripennis]